MGGYYDPAYAYLFNSLNLSQFEGLGVAHVDHPGTTVQIAGALVIKAVHYFSGGDPDIKLDLLKKPEYYISCIVFSFILFTAICDYILGFIAYKKLKSISVALILQLIPFYSPTIFDHIADLSSESFLIPSVLLIIAVTGSYTAENILNKNREYLYSLIYGFVTGFGLASKLTFFPLMILPLLLLKKYKFKFIYIVLSTLFFVIFVSPAVSLSNVFRFSEWMTGIITHSGQYGTGPKYVIHGESFTRNIINIFSYEIHFDIVYFLILITFCLQFFPKFRKNINNKKLQMLLNGIFISMTIYIIIISKHFEYHYLIPVYMICIPGLVCLYFVYENFIKDNKRKKVVIMLYILFSLFITYQFFHLFNEFGYYSFRRDETKKLEEYRKKNYPDIPYISGTISNKEYCLYFGASYSGEGNNRYFPIIKNLYKDFIYFDKYIKDFYYTDIELIRNAIEENGKIIFRTDEIELVPPLEEKLKIILHSNKITSKEIFKNENGEMLFEITHLK